MKSVRRGRVAIQEPGAYPPLAFALSNRPFRKGENMKISVLSVPILVILAVALAFSPSTIADSCDCNYDGGPTNSCSAEQTCPENVTAHCSCTPDGCTTSCGSPPANQQTSFSTLLGMTLGRFTLQPAGLRGIAAHFETMLSGKIAFNIDADLPDARQEKTYENLTLEELLIDAADDFGACVDFDEANNLVLFREAGECS